MALIAMAGLPGSGKTSIARALGSALDAPVLDKDAIRSALFAPRFVTYTQQQDDVCMRVAYQAAEHLFVVMRRPCVILDGRTYRRHEQVVELVAFAARIEQRLCVIECVCTEVTARARIESQRARGTHPAENRTPDLYSALRDTQEEIDVEKIVLDTDSELLETCVRRAQAYVLRVTAQH